VVIGDSEGHVGLGIKTSKEVATAIRAAIIIAKLSVLPIRRGYWGTNLGVPHSLPTKESGKCGSVSVRVSIPNFNIESSPAYTYISQAHPRSSRHRPRGLPGRQAPPPTRRRRRHLHLLFRLDQDPREHPQGHLRRRRQHVRIPDPKPVEGDEAHPESPGGVRRRSACGEEVLDKTVVLRVRVAFYYAYGNLYPRSLVQ
jgi:hypothetical protein